MKPFLASLAAIALAATASAQTLPVDLEPGRYAGTDQFGQACTLDIKTSLDSEKFSGFEFRTPGFAYDVWLGSPQTSTPGTLVHKTSLMFDRYAGGRMAYKSIVGAPIFGKTIRTDFEIRYRDGRPESVKMTKVSKGLSGERKTAESCNNLRK